MVLDSVVSANSKRNHAQALDGFFPQAAIHASAPDEVESDDGRAGAFDGKRSPLSGEKAGV